MQIIIFREKHGDAIYDASTKEALSRACASVIKERFDQGWWYHAPQKPDLSLSADNQEILNLTEEQVDAIPAAIRNGIIEARAKLQRRVDLAKRQYEIDLKEYQALEKVATAPTLEEAAGYHFFRTYKFKGEEKQRAVYLAIHVMEGRSDYEYEGYSIEQVQEPSW